MTRRLQSLHSSTKGLGLSRPALAGIIVFALVLTALPLLTSGVVILGVAILALLYAILGQAWNILGGYTGQVSLGNAVYFGIGAYTSTLLLLKWNVTPWLGMVAGALVAVVFGLLIGLPTFRLRGHYFVTVTLVINAIVQIVFDNWPFVGGAEGLYVPLKNESILKSFVHFQLGNSKMFYYYMILLIFFVVMVVTWRVERSKWGYCFRAIRDDSDAASSIGINPFYYKNVANSLNAAISAVGGTFYAQYILFLNPGSVFDVWISVLVLVIPVLGGKGTLWGPVLGAFVLIPLSEVTRIYFGGGGRAVDLLIYGLLVMVVSVIEPRGLIALRGRFMPRQLKGGG